MEKEHLYLLINEEIYQLPEDKKISDVDETVSSSQTAEKTLEVAETQSARDEKQKIDQKQKTEESKVHIEPKKQSTEIPIQKIPTTKEIHFAIFHNSTNPSEQELLQKIIDACKLSKDQYQIFENGFDQSVKFKKALVFTPEAKAFYTPVSYKNNEFLCSKPLSEISGEVQEKAKLWGALQKFIILP